METRDTLLGRTDTKPNISTLRIIGSMVYKKIHVIPRLQRMTPRASTGYLVGYQAWNIHADGRDRRHLPARARLVHVRWLIRDPGKYPNARTDVDINFINHFGQYLFYSIPVKELKMDPLHPPV
jgi:hypothetical protein